MWDTAHSPQGVPHPPRCIVRMTASDPHYAPHDRDYLRALLSRRNQTPGDSREIDAAIEQAFVRTVSILVVDMCGFSRITQRHGIVHFLAMIHQMEQASRPAIAANGGDVVKQEADNLFAVFRHPAQALDAALDILRALDAMNAVMPPERALHVSVGIGHGPTLLVAGEDLFGPEMNHACKLGEDIAGAGEILLTQPAHDALPHGRHVFTASPVEIGGHPLAAFRYERSLFVRPLPGPHMP